MPSVLLKQRPPSGKIMRNLADELMSRMSYGKIVIVVDNPSRYIGPLRKRWLRLARRVRVERASTLDPIKIAQLESKEGYMRSMRFTVKYPPDKYHGNVYVVSLNRALLWPPECSTMFILSDLELHEKYLLTAWMSSYSLVVLYEDWK
jgi:hypothetical protein